VQGPRARGLVRVRGGVDQQGKGVEARQGHDELERLPEGMGEEPRPEEAAAEDASAAKPA